MVSVCFTVYKSIVLHSAMTIADNAVIESLRGVRGYGGRRVCSRVNPILVLLYSPTLRKPTETLYDGWGTCLKQRSFLMHVQQSDLLSFEQKYIYDENRRRCHVRAGSPPL